MDSRNGNKYDMICYVHTVVAKGLSLHRNISSHVHVISFYSLNEYYDNNKFWLVNVSYQYSIVLVSHNFQYFVLILYYCFIVFYHTIQILCQFQWPRGLRRRSAAARLLRSWVRIPPGAWMFVCCECCVLSGSGLCDELIIRPEESYWLWCVIVCDLENLKNEEAMTRVGSQRHQKNSDIILCTITTSNIPFL